MPALYRHTPLDRTDKHQIRILSLSLGGLNDNLQATITRATLSEKHVIRGVDQFTNNKNSIGIGEINAPPIVQYEALSYTWGEGLPTESLTIDECVLKISVNLATCLKYLRYPDQSRLLWIDAICLDQKNEAEKRHQIPIMHQIYAQASRVVVWLGVPDPSSTIAFQYVLDLHSPVEAGKEEEISDTIDFHKWPLSFLARTPYSLNDIESSFAFYKLMLRDWWYRAWIVQEITFAPQVIVQCGEEIISWAQLRVALHIHRMNHYIAMDFTDIEARGLGENPTLESAWPAHAINNALSLEYDRRRILRGDLYLFSAQSLYANDLSWALGINKGRKCQLPHDRTYSILGIAGEKFSNHIEAKYSHSPAEHDRNVVRAFFAASGSLDIILHGQHSAWNPNKSSWAPDWGSSERAAVLHVNGQHVNYEHMIRQSDVEVGVESPFLKVNALKLGTIKEIALECQGYLDPIEPFYKTARYPMTGAPKLPPQRRIWWERAEEFQAFELFMHIRRQLPASHPLWKNHLELFLIAMSQRFFPTAQKHVHLPPAEAEVPQEKQLTEDEAQEFENMLVWLLTSRTLCIAEDDRLVIAPDYTDHGDVVALVANCSGPTIFRRLDSGEYTMIGDAYVMGLTKETREKGRLERFCVV